MTHRTTALVLVAPLALAAWLAPSASAQLDSSATGGASQRAHHRVHPQALPVIRGEVGPGFTITMNEDSVPRGRYKFVIKDNSTMHNFHLTGPGVNESTTVPFTGKVVWKLRLRPGDYRAQCDPHASSMNTSLEVTG